MSSRFSRSRALPEARDGEGEERQRAPLALDLRHHLVDERLVLEAVAAREGGLHERAPQPARAERRRAASGRQDRRERLVVVAADQEVVAHREEDVDVGLEHEPPEESRERAPGPPAG